MNADQLIAVGVNCLHPSLVSPLITSIREANKFGPPIPTIAYPNNGEHYDTSKKWYLSIMRFRHLIFNNDFPCACEFFLGRCYFIFTRYVVMIKNAVITKEENNYLLSLSFKVKICMSRIVM